MADGFVGLDPDSTGKKVDMSELTVGGVTVERERMVLSDNSDPVAFAAVKNSAPGGADYGVVARIAGGVDVSGSTIIAVTGGLTDAQLRALAVPVSGPLTDAQLRALAVPVSGPLTDAQLRALAVPVSGTFFQATQPVSGTFWQATQPISAAALPLPAGASTEATLALIKAKTDNLDVALSTRTKPADTQPVSLASQPLPTGASTEATSAAISGKLPATLGQKAMAASMSVVIASDQTPPVPVFKGRAGTFRTLGRAGTAGQKILSIHNATGSTVVVTVTKIIVDLMQTVVKAITVAPPIVRVWKVTVLPTNGSAVTKNKIGGSGATSASVTLLQDSSADGTGSGTTLTATLPAGTIITQEFAPRMLTGGANYEPADRMEFFGAGEEIELQALEGLVVFLDYSLATQNPVTDMWIAGVEWREK